MHVVASGEVLGDASLFTLVLKSHRQRVRRELNVSDNISPLVAPVGDDRVPSKSSLDQGFPMMLPLRVPLHLVDLGQTRFRAHELEDTVNTQHRSELALNRSSLKP